MDVLRSPVTVTPRRARVSPVERDAPEGGGVVQEVRHREEKQHDGRDSMRAEHDGEGEGLPRRRRSVAPPERHQRHAGQGQESPEERLVRDAHPREEHGGDDENRGRDESHTGPEGGAAPQRIATGRRPVQQAQDGYPDRGHEHRQHAAQDSRLATGQEQENERVGEGRDRRNGPRGVLHVRTSDGRRSARRAGCCGQG
jgi:hypothetical protein